MSIAYTGKIKAVSKRYSTFLMLKVLMQVKMESIQRCIEGVSHQDITAGMLCTVTECRQGFTV